MMAHAVVPKDRLREILGSLLGKYRLVAPVREGSTLVYKEVNNVDDVVLGDDIPYKSPKEFLFPQVEKIMTFSKDGELKPNEEAPETIIVGVKPCDLEALKVMTAVFTKGKYVDTYFERKLKNILLIGLGCKSEKPGCFCAERGINREYSSACDIFLTDEGDSFTATVISDKGRDVLKDFDLERKDRQETDQNESSQAPVLDIDADENTLFNNTNGDGISEKCLGCGTCAFVCPTCHCFEFKDVVVKGEAIRYRCWDSCMYPKFTLHASGHNPRPSKKERYRQRVMHKYLYVKQNFGYVACTGCGRCIRSCPVGMNIKSVVSEIMEELK